MTTAIMTYTVSPVWIKLKSFGHAVISAFESMGRARAAAELHRLGYTKEAKALMLRED